MSAPLLGAEPLTVQTMPDAQQTASPDDAGSESSASSTIALPELGTGGIVGADDPAWSPIGETVSLSSGPSHADHSPTIVASSIPSWDTGPSPTASFDAVSGGRSDAVPSAPVPGPAPVRPTLSAQRLATSLQRQVDDGAAGDGSFGTGVPAPVQGSQPASHRSLRAETARGVVTAGLQGAAVHRLSPVQRLVAGGQWVRQGISGPGPFADLRAQAGSSGAASGSAGSFGQTVSRYGGPAAGPSAPARSPGAFGFPSPGDVAVAAGIAQRMEDGAVVFQPPPSFQSHGYGGASFAGPSSQSSPPSEPPPVQRVEVAASPPAAGPPPSGAPGALASAASSGDLDDLARRLYPKIRPYLKKELWLDRERMGRLMDTGR